jgi:uncharacterized protein (DUF1330 family)
LITRGVPRATEWHNSTQQKEYVMNSKFKTILAVVVGAAFGAAAMQGLHAQSKKAYTISELETLDAAAQAQYVPKIQAAQKAAGARNFNTAGGRIEAMTGAAPKRVAITEWDSLDKAKAFYSSPAWNELAPLRDKAVKTIRRYAVEAVN